jgi:hypothetical protein
VLSALLVVLLVVAVGTRATDKLRVRQQEVILQNLPQPEAVAYYRVLRGRVRRVALLRVVALASLVALGYCYKLRAAGQRGPFSAARPAPAASSGAASN